MATKLAVYQSFLTSLAQKPPIIYSLGYLDSNRRVTTTTTVQIIKGLKFDNLKSYCTLGKIISHACSNGTYCSK